jgi:hypothetical protein
MSWDLGWKKKAERLRMVILSAGHQGAKELGPGLAKMLAIYRQIDETGVVPGLEEELAGLSPDAERPLWEPIEVHGWTIEATMYLQNGKLWWLLHAQRRNENVPSKNDVALLDKVLGHLGADPERDMILGPRSNPAEESLAFGWWTWFNRMPLFEIQAHKDKKKDKEKIRVVPLGTRPSDGYQSLGDLDENEEKP